MPEWNFDKFVDLLTKSAPSVMLAIFLFAYFGVIHSSVEEKENRALHNQSEMVKQLVSLLDVIKVEADTNKKQIAVLEKMDHHVEKSTVLAYLSCRNSSRNTQELSVCDNPGKWGYGDDDHVDPFMLFIPPIVPIPQTLADHFSTYP